jgi:hypothetical protein
MNFWRRGLSGNIILINPVLCDDSVPLFAAYYDMFTEQAVRYVAGNHL